MTERRPELPEFDRLDLRSHGAGEAGERVWRRLSRSLAEQERPAAPQRRAAWTFALAATTFGAGLWLGRESNESAHPAQARLSAEPAQQAGLAAPRPSTEALLPEPARTDDDGVSLDDVRPRRHVTSKLASKPSVPVASAQAELPGPEPSGAPSGDAVATAELAPNRIAEVSEPPRWQRLANGGEYEAALFELAQAGGFESVFDGASAEQLMLLADIARATGQRQRAISALRNVLEHFPADPVAPLAAWSLGRALEKAGDRRGASEAFATYRALSPEGDFAEDALVRQLRSAVQRSERELAEQLAEQYARDFTDGRHQAEVAQLASEVHTMVAGEADAGTAASPLQDAIDIDVED